MHMPNSAAHILFADDDGYYRDLGAELLVEHGFRVKTARDGAECLELLEQHRFDLAIIDLEMPHVGGFDILAHIRKDPQHVDMPVIVITGHDDSASIEKAYFSGASSFMTKPFDWALFLHQVRYVLKASQTEIELRAAARNVEFMHGLQDRFIQSLVKDAHDPLRAATNLSTIIELEADGPIGSPYYANCIAEISTALRRIQATHLKMLQWSASIAQAIKLDEARVDLRQLLNLCCGGAEARCKRRHVDFASEVQMAGDALITCDRPLFIQAIQCVIEEATQMARPSGNVFMRSAIISGMRLLIEIRDDVSLHAAMKRDPDAPPRKKGEGERLSTSLQVAKAIIEAHGGVFKAVSESGLGTAVEIVIPAERIAMISSPPTSSLRSGSPRVPMLSARPAQSSAAPAVVA